MPSPGHSLLAPSAAHRWVGCTASVKLIEDNDAILPKSGGREADEGTRAHQLLTDRLTGKPGVSDGAEMTRIIDECVQYIKGLMVPGDTILVDQRVPLFYLTTQTGTLDVAILGNARSIFIDLKYGVGVGVYAENNEQLAIYAQSCIRDRERKAGQTFGLPVELVIYQPRDRNDSTCVRSWSLTSEDLDTFCHRIGSAALEVLSDRGTKFAPGTACKFCRATGICRSYATHGLTALSDEPLDAIIETRIALPFSPATLTREQRQRLLIAKPDMMAFLQAVENQEVAELMTDAAPLSFKLVEGKSNRQWTDEGKATKFLLDHLKHDQIYPPIPAEILSPAQAEKLLPKEVKKGVAGFVTKPPGKPTLVQVSDNRPALVFNPTAGLADLGDNPQDLI